MLELMQQLYPIKGIVQHYAWGGTHFIPELLGLGNPVNDKYAELWMGTHPRGTAFLENDVENRSLADLIASDPREFLGEQTVAQFGNTLPFLFKVLDVQNMLSIQAHPTKAAAVIGFEKENKAGVPISAGHRNYKDDNHKPEVMVALTDFWLLHGFKSMEGITKVLQEVPEFHALQAHFQRKSIFVLYKYLMEMPQAEVDKLLAPLQNRLLPAFENNAFGPHQADYWASLAFKDYTREGHFDRGIFSIYLFNLVFLKTGQGIFQDAGVPHAYLEGVNMELMANSDNVFRGGLTPKHIDVPELLHHLVFESITPRILQGRPRSAFEQVYPTTAPDFELSKVVLENGNNFQKAKVDGPEIWIVTKGEVEVRNAQEVFIRKKGEIFFVKNGAQYQFSAKENAVLFRAGMPR